MAVRSVMAAVLLLLSVASGCGGQAPDPAPSVPRDISDYGAPTATRIAFCDLLPTAAVAAALGGESDDQRQWDNGDQIDVGGASEVVHESGCEWSLGRGDDLAIAKAWIFARPVDRAVATEVVKAARRGKQCDVSEPTGFGDPALLQTCRLAENRQRVRRAGLFGDTWLTCEIAAPHSPDLTDRVARWCVEVADVLTRPEEER